MQTVYDRSGYIKDWYSELSFDGDEKFLNYLVDNHGIDVNPKSGEFTFDLDCNVEQRPIRDYSSERVGTRVTLRRVYNSNKMNDCWNIRSCSDSYCAGASIPCHLGSKKMLKNVAFLIEKLKC